MGSDKDKVLSVAEVKVVATDTAEQLVVDGEVVSVGEMLVRIYNNQQKLMGGLL